MNAGGKKILIPVETMFNDQKFWYPYYRLQEAGIYEDGYRGAGRLERLS